MTRLDSVRLTQDLLRLNTINPPGSEDACARVLGAILEKAGFSVRRHEFAPGRTSLVARIGGLPEKPPLCLTGHMDTVPLGSAAWSKDPFAGEIDSGRLFGRGSSDMKSGLAALVAGAVALAPRLERTAGLELVLTASEENGCQGAFRLLRGKALGRAGAMVVAEPTSNYPLVGHKGALWLRALASGVTAHGSMPEQGVNAIYKAARAIGKLEAFRFGDAPHALMGHSTLNVGTVHGGMNINSVPDAAALEIDIRTVPGVNHRELIAELAKRLAPEAALEPIVDIEPVYTEPQNEWIASVFQVMEPILGETPAPRTATYFTDAAPLGEAYGQPPTVILGPGEPAMAHRTDEYCVLDRIGQSVAAYEEIIARWCLT